MYIKIANSQLWFDLYYKHTKRHKKDLKDTKNRVLQIKRRALNK